MSRKRALSPSPATSKNQAHSPDIYVSAPIEDRSSTFIAHFSPSLPAKSLQAHPDFKTATHRIAAWRKPSSQRALSPNLPRLFDTGSDEDGERYAGKRLERVLEAANVEGAIVVARWYGGVLLGPIRFVHIEVCARDAIRRWRERTRGEDEERTKRIKVVDEERERARLAAELAERDGSIGMLRKLLADKTQPDVKSSQESSSAAPTTPVTPVKTPDYARMPLEALKRLDKARDATIAFLLKQIDKAEQRDSSPKSDPAPSAAANGADENG
ncbi:hypothetical protein H2201_007462 [Coniosporium apollinis]|uniref:Impact N-terminal domain-containing protein n=1 Tax=Coniosporium apollinis TaxID=61459 RepID=A0ABQ9NIU9_9PEZI|nr:hypothetical protein H2201_007462 [Coniosporium apollinis]